MSYKKAKISDFDLNLIVEFVAKCVRPDKRSSNNFVKRHIIGKEYRGRAKKQ